jgi:menaquinone-specific isochorismate synthase
VERVEKLPPPTCAIPTTSRFLIPEKKEWIQGIEKALKAIKDRELEKVVLARSCTLTFSEPPDPFAIASALQQKAEGAFVFCIEGPTFSFLGATPERLFSRKGTQIESEAVAGTRPRGQHQEEDKALRTVLLSSAKDLRELNPVQMHLKTSLKPFITSPLRFSPLSIHLTQNVQHLYKSCTAQLKENISDEEILDQLHPTPALCGTPKPKALEIISLLEPFQRGLYGGVLGWTKEDQSEWIVGIRSCLLQGNTATLFTGTGIVQGSHPEEEWDELDQKLNLYRGIFL